MRIFIIFLLSLFTTVAHASPLTFYNLTTKDGLSHNSVISIYQDRRGYMWFGTRDGLNMYDGNVIRNYKFNKDQKKSLSGNHISEIIGNGENEIYISTDRGLVAYNITSDSFSALADSDVHKLAYYNHHLYYAHRNKLYRFEDNNSVLVCELPVETIISGLSFVGDSIYLGTYDGLYLYAGNQTIDCLIPEIHVFDIFKDSKEQLWVSSYDGKGLFLVRKDQVKCFRHSDKESGTLSSNYTHRCVEDKNGDIWVGTFNGLNRYDVTTGRFSAYFHNHGEKGLTESSIWSLYCDVQGNIWAGTYYGGVNYFNPGRQLFHEFYARDEEGEGLSVSTVGRMIEDTRGRLWICTEGGGVNQYDLKTERFKWFRHDNHNNSISQDNAKCLYYDEDRDELWIGTHMGGLNRLKVKTGHFDVFHHQKYNSQSLPSDIVMDIVPYRGKLIVATFRGVVFFDPANGRCSDIFPTRQMSDQIDEIYKILLDLHENLWIICHSRHRVARYGLQTGEMEILRSDEQTADGISTGNVYDVFEDRNGLIWFCTNGYGVDVYDPELDKFRNYDVRKNNLISNVVYAVEQIDDESYVISTDQGISLFDLKDGSSVNYRRNKELPLSSINEYSLLKASNGEIFVGGMDGLIAFTRENLGAVQQMYDIAPSRLWVNSVEVSVDDSTGILSKALYDTRSIELDARQNTFVLQYGATTYLPFDRLPMEYQLKGASKLWQPMTDDRYIAFNNLEAGEYVLKVRTLLKDGSVHRSHDLKLIVHPPFYKSVWAYLLYAAVVLLLVWVFVGQYNHRVRLREQLRYEKKNAENIKKMTQSKLRFFTNISHEFRTPLSIITGYVEMILAKQEVSGPLKKSLMKVYKNCVSLNELISELLDFRKMEQGFMTIKVSRHDLVSYLYENFLLFDEFASERHIDYRFVKSHDEIQVWFDVSQMRKVINNLLSNAFKNVSDKGKITVSVRQSSDSVVIEVCNSGKGLTQEEMANIFDRFYQADNQPLTNGTGIGLNLTKGIVELHHGEIGVYSNLGVDTTFFVRLPLGNKHFREEEIIDNNEEIATLSPVRLTNSTIDDAEDLTAGEESLKEESEPPKRFKMLVVEDNQNLRGMLEDWFSAFYEVTVAADGEEGLASCREVMPDIIVSDVVMPKVSGIELCRILKEDPQTCNIPIILLTALTNENYKIEGFQLGADDYVCKPFNMQLLLTRCNNLVKSRLAMKNSKTAPVSMVADNLPVNNVLDQEFMDKARRIVSENMDNPDFNVNTFAQEIGVSRTLLFMRLKNISDHTPNEFIVEIKIEHAVELLDHHPELNITQISDELGFSTKQFRKYFKDKYGVTPLEYRNKNISKPDQRDED